MRSDIHVESGETQLTDLGHLIKKICEFIPTGALALTVLFWTSSRASAAFEIRSSIESSLTPLTTERVWLLDPDEPKPHLRRWIVERRLELEGMKAVQHSQGVFHVVGGHLALTSRIHVRGVGPWFFGWEVFPCGEANSSSWMGVFSNVEGSALAAAEAARLWNQMVTQEQKVLERKLSEVAARTEGAALILARSQWASWLKDIDRRWRQRAELVARKTEWDHYKKKAQTLGVCQGRGKNQRLPPLPPIEMRMEPTFGEPRMVLAARAPAKRWDGFYSVRVTARAGDLILNGQFLIDPSAETSLVAPSWLNRQGVDARGLAVLSLPPRTLEWIRDRNVAPFVALDDVAIGGRSLDLTVFGLMETEVFYPPHYPGLCCDGVLGRDFLKKFPIGFDPSASVGVNVYEPNGFQRDSTDPWKEMTRVPTWDFGKRFKSQSVVYDFPHGRVWY